MVFVLFVCLGGYLLVSGLRRGIPRAARAGIALVVLAAWDLGVFVWALSTHTDVAIRVDLVVVIPLGLYWGWQGARSLRAPPA